MTQQMTAHVVDTPASERVNTSLTCPMGVQEIYDLLPHAYPFLLLDRVVSIDAQSAVALKNVTATEWWNPGHFPGNPIMPGVLILEAMAHVGGLVERARAHEVVDDTSSPGLSLLAGVKRVRFREVVRPGDQLRVTAAHLASASSLSEFRCEAFVGATLVAEATISLVSTPRRTQNTPPSRPRTQGSLTP